jgi:hypothetical protein
MSDDLLDMSSGGEEDERELNVGLFRAVSNYDSNDAARYFELDAQTRAEYRDYDRTRARIHRAHRRRLSQPPKSEVAPEADSATEEEVEEDDEAEAEQQQQDGGYEEAGRPQEVALATVREEAEAEAEVEPAVDAAVAGKDRPREDERGVPLKADGSVDKAALWQRYRKLARQELVEQGMSVKSAHVNDLARSWWRSDNWATA